MDHEEDVDAHDLLGRDFRNLLEPKSAELLRRAFTFPDLNIVNPLRVATAKSKRPLYAIIHRTTEGVVIDFEPILPEELAQLEAGAIEKHGLASASITKLQQVAPGELQKLADTVAQEVKSLTGYERVMVYRFHEDQHGEVISEVKEDFLEPYLGLHFPANDVPQATREAYVKVRLRLIVDNEAPNVDIIQDPALPQPMILTASTLRGVSGCHKEYSRNLKCSGTLVMAIVVTIGHARIARLWGLVVCHHRNGPKMVPYPQRYACDLIKEALALQLAMDIEASEEAHQKREMHTRAMLCSMLTRYAPLGIITQNPGVHDLVPCEGAALICKGQVIVSGTAPRESEVADLAKWLLEKDDVEEGVYVTNSLEGAGYPGAAALGPTVCGLAVAVVNREGDLIMWFRSGIAQTIKWAGDKSTHAPPDGVNLHPRYSFDAYYEIARQQSPAWEDPEIEMMQMLRLLVKDSLPENPDLYAIRFKIQTHLNNERLKVQRQLIEVSRKLHSGMEGARTPVIGLSGSCNVYEWNTRASKLMQLDKGAVMGKPFSSVIAEESHEIFRHALEAVSAGNELEPIDLCLKAGDGDRLYLLMSLYGQHDMHGKLVGIRMVGQDISLIKLLSRQAQLAGAELGRRLDGTDMLAFGIDKDWKITQWNRHMEEVLDIGKDNVLGKHLIRDVLKGNPMIMDPEDALVLFDIGLGQALQGRDLRNHEFRFRTMDGQQMDTLLHVISRLDTSKVPVGAVCFLQDMVERRTAENATAVRIVGEAASHAKTMQLACLCHEISSPLDGILKSIKYMEDTEMTRQQRELVATTSVCGEFLQGVVQNMLNASLIREGRLELLTENFMLSQVMSEILAQESSHALERGLKLYGTQDPACNSAIVTGDSLRVKQVVANFARNAVESTAVGWVEIKLKAAAPSKEGTFRFIFKVSDSGKGMSMQRLTDTFEMQPQDRPIRARGSNPGLGLGVCKNLAKIMGGSLSFESREGQGSGFSLDLELPLAPPGAEVHNSSDALIEQEGVIHTTIGEWSTTEQLQAAQVVSPTAPPFWPLKPPS
eukprot:SM000072S21193  [mRNA]  locus=s72:221603:229349:+ [translate_table: standard]